MCELYRVAIGAEMLTNGLSDRLCTECAKKMRKDVYEFVREWLKNSKRKA